MKNKISNKKKFFSKLFVKLIRKFGYEIIDQANLEIPGINKNINDNLSKSGSKSISIPLGTTNIKNKINSFTIIIRSYTFGDVDDKKVMLDQNKQRIYEFPKIEYTLRTIKSIIRSCEYSKEFFKDLDIKIIITDDKSSKDNLDKIKRYKWKRYFKKYDFKYEEYIKINTNFTTRKFRSFLFFRR